MPHREKADCGSNWCERTRQGLSPEGSAMTLKFHSLHQTEVVREDVVSSGELLEGGTPEYEGFVSVRFYEDVVHHGSQPSTRFAATKQRPARASTWRAIMVMSLIPNLDTEPKSLETNIRLAHLQNSMLSLTTNMTLQQADQINIFLLRSRFPKTCLRKLSARSCRQGLPDLLETVKHLDCLDRVLCLVGFQLSCGTSEGQGVPHQLNVENFWTFEAYTQLAGPQVFAHKVPTSGHADATSKP